MPSNVVVPQSWNPHPPGCSCGCCGDQWSQVMECWKQIADFKAFLKQMLTEIGPFPLTGVVDGSNAAPGVVGEFINASSVQTYLGYPTASQWVIQSPIVVQPGDWDLWAFMNFSGLIGGAFFALSPVPAGISNQMSGQLFQTGTEGEAVNIIGTTARGSFTQQTLLAFTGNINNSTDSALVGGTASLIVQGRRVR